MKLAFLLLFILLTSIFGFAQIPTATLVKIVKAEDARAYDKSLEDLMKAPNPAVQIRTALAAGRIGDAAAVPVLTALLEKEQSEALRAMAAFALGEIESIKGSETILKTLQDSKTPDSVRARAVEAAGKIAAANAKDPKAKYLGEAILDTLVAEDKRGARQNREVVLLGLTAALRAKPENASLVAAKFLTNHDARVRADAANTLSRLRAKNADDTLRAMLLSDTDADARANAARALGAAEDKDALNLLVNAATKDIDSRVRVSAIRALALIKEANAAEPLIVSGEHLMGEYEASAFRRSHTQNELLEIFTALGRLIPNSRNERAVNLIRRFGNLRDKGHSTEAYVARMRIAPGRGDDKKTEMTHWRQYSTLAQVVGEFSSIEPTDDEGKRMKSEASGVLRPLADAFARTDPVKDKETIMAGPDVLQAYARLKTADLGEIARVALRNEDVQIRAAAAGIIADLPQTKENVDALKTAFARAIITDKKENDAQLANLDAIFKLDKKESVGTLLVALTVSDYLVRKKAFELLADKDLQKDFPGILRSLEVAHLTHKDQVLPFSAAFGTKLGQVLNTDADYRRALSRKNGSVKAVLTTEKGTFTIVFSPEEAPLTVDNFIKLARSNYFNGLEVHRVVPNFVMQDGDPRGDGNGGPGWSIRCEVNMLAYDRGAVGMALSGKDTGGSQWFVTHSPQPHLDGGYTVFGHVSETDMKVVDNIVRGDKIISVKIIGR